MPKVYSILVHPSNQSLNFSLFKIANNYFTQKGYEVDTVNLYNIREELYTATDKLEQTKIPLIDRRYKSDYNYNYSSVLKYSAFTAAEVEKLKTSDILYIQTPIMVWMMPGILKQYLESVFVPEGVFRVEQPWSADFELTRFIAGKKVFFSIVLGAGAEYTDYIMGSVDNLINPIKSIFCKFVGYEWVEPHIIFGITKTSDKRQDYLDSFQDHLNKIFIDNK